MITNILLYIASVVIWGSTWLAIEFQLGVVAIELSLGYRNFGAALLAFAWCALRSQSLRFDWRAHRYFVLLGCFLFGLNYILAYAAQIYLTSALNAICFSAMVWMNILNARLFTRAQIDARTYGGAFLGIVGIIVLFWPEVQNVSWSNQVLIGAALSLISAFIASIGNMVSQAAQHNGLPVMPMTAWGMLYASFLNVGLALGQGKPLTFDPSVGYVVSLVFLAVFGSVAAFGCYLTLLGRIGAARAGYVVVAVPIVALFLSAKFEGLALEMHIFIGVAFVLAGNIAILTKGRRKQSTPTYAVKAGGKLAG